MKLYKVLRHPDLDRLEIGIDSYIRAGYVCSGSLLFIKDVWHQPMVKITRDIGISKKDAEIILMMLSCSIDDRMCNSNSASAQMLFDLEKEAMAKLGFEVGQNAPHTIHELLNQIYSEC